VNKRETDISQIKKYLDGELDARAMHQLERRAQDDPFLMDAMEGYEKTGKDQQVHLNELTNRLHDRITQKKARIIPLRLIGIAASILLVCSIGGWWLLNNHSANTPKLALAVKPESKKTVTVDTVIPQPKAEVAAVKQIPRTVHPRQFKEERKAAAPAVSSVAIPEAVATVKTAEPVSKDTTPLNEMVVMENTAQQKKGRVAGVPIANDKSQITNVPTSKTIIKGSVTGKNDGLPVVGAAIRVAGTTKTAVTDVNGNFALPVDSGKVKLIVSYIGYNAQVVNIQDKDVVKIALQPSSAALAEVAVTGYSSQKKKDIALATTNLGVAKAKKLPDSSDQLLTEQKVGADVGRKSTPVLVNGRSLPETLAGKNKLSKNIIHGRVIGKDDGKPIPGASVLIAGTNTGVVTDVNGRFTIPVDSSKAKLLVASVGYRKVEVNTLNPDVLKTIILDANNSALNEVVVTGYDSKKDNDNTVTDAHPKDGWASFKKYLKTGAVSPDGKTGTVKLSFQVDANGTISNIKVVKGLDKETDQKAMDLITDGPTWLGSTSGQVENVSLRVKFVK
jgi:hypothetical protein